MLYRILFSTGRIHWQPDLIWADFVMRALTRLRAAITAWTETIWRGDYNVYIETQTRGVEI